MDLRTSVNAYRMTIDESGMAKRTDSKERISVPLDFVAKDTITFFKGKNKGVKKLIDSTVKPLKIIYESYDFSDTRLKILFEKILCSES